MIDRESKIAYPRADLSRSLVNTMPGEKPKIREIKESDLKAIGDLLTRGFVYRKHAYWMRGLQRQAVRPLPDGVPRYGYLIENEGKPVGCLLTIYASRTRSGEPEIFCNVSSWYVDPEFRNYAALFASMTQKRKDVTYLNVTPARSTWPILEAQGFECYGRGQYFSIPALSRRRPGISIQTVTACTAGIEGLDQVELELLKRHAGYGCLSLVCHTANDARPFIFFHLRKRRGFIPVPAMQLGYCRDIADFVNCAGLLGKALLRRGKAVVIIDANGAIEGLRGTYREADERKYFRGPYRPRLGDLADTELAIYGM
jgi:hypothetical protein